MPGDSLLCPTGSLAGLPLSAAWKAAVEAAEELLMGEPLVLGLLSDEVSSRCFFIGVSGKAVLLSWPLLPSETRCEKATVRFFEGVVAGINITLVVVHGLMADFTSDFSGEVGMGLGTWSGCDDIDASAELRF